MESVGQSREPLRERSVIGGSGTSEPGDVQPEEVAPTIGRRALLGIGVAAGAFAIGGAHVADADVGHAAAIQGVTLIAMLTAPPGLTSITKDYASWIPYGGSKIISSSYMGATGATTTNAAAGGGGLGFDLPAGSQIHKMDLTLHSSVALSASSMDATAYITQAGGPVQVFGSFLGAGGPGFVNRTLTPATPRVLAFGEALSVLSVLDTTRAFISATLHYLPPTAGMVPITPKRVYDSRAGARIVLDETRVISVATGTDGSPNVIPPGARAIAYNITITDTVTGFGYLTVVPGGAPTGGPSSVNWDKVSATIANGLQVGLDSNRQVSVYCSGVPGAATHFIIDVVGYFL